MPGQERRDARRNAANGKEACRWCDACGTILLGESCSECGSPGRLFEINSPGDVRPCMGDSVGTVLGLFREAFGTDAPLRGKAMFLNKVPGEDRADEVIACGAVIGVARFDLRLDRLVLDLRQPGAELFADAATKGVVVFGNMAGHLKGKAVPGANVLDVRGDFEAGAPIVLRKGGKVGPGTALGVVRYVLCFLLLPLLPTTLSCVVGGLIALIISRLRNKNIFTLVLSLLFLGVYFAFCFNMETYVQKLVQNGEAIGSAVQKALPPFYALGMALEVGDWGQLAVFALWCILPFGLVYAVLSRFFLGIVTAKKGEKRVKYEAKALHTSSARWSMTVKELRRLGSSSAYMLNGCLGAILAVGVAVLTAVKGQSILQTLANVYAGGADVNAIMMPMALVVECFALSMVIISAPSISLEGKNLWVLQTAPVRAADVLLRKVYAPLIVAVPACLVSSLLFVLSLPIRGGDMLMHDWWCALWAAAVGRIGFVSLPTILYRQHGDNVVGAKDVRSFRYMATWMNRLSQNAQSLRNTQAQAAAFLATAGDDLTERQKKLLSDYAAIGGTGKWNRWAVLRRHGIWLLGARRKIAEMMLI